MRKNIPGAGLDEKTYCGQLRFSVPVSVKEDMYEHGVRIGSLFKLLEASKEPLGIEYYSIGQTTMDEVFCK